MANTPYPKHPEPYNYVVSRLIAVDDVPVSGPPLDVPKGAAVYVRAHNGTDAGNAHVLYLASTREDTSAASRRSNLAPNTQIPFPVSNLRDVWVSGKAGDGAVIQIVGAAS